MSNYHRRAPLHLEHERLARARQAADVVGETASRVLVPGNSDLSFITNHTLHSWVSVRSDSKPHSRHGERRAELKVESANLALKPGGQGDLPS